MSDDPAVTYDEVNGLVYARIVDRIADGESAYQIEVESIVIVDYDVNGRVLGFEIMLGELPPAVAEDEQH
jgi:uncharacterized protein YuzE